VKTVAVVHPTSLLGKELRQRLAARSELVRDLRLLSDDEEEIGQLTEAAGAAAFVGRLDADALADVELVFFCGAADGDREALAGLPRGAVAVLLVDGSTADGLPAAVAGVREDLLAGHDRVVAPPAEVVLVATLAGALAAFELRRVDGTVFAPVSEQGEGGIDELFEQTRRILAFEGAPKPKLFPAQIAFNLLPSARDAAGVEAAVRQALGDACPISLQLLQGGVFHGVAASLRVELGRDASVAEVRKALGRARAVTLARDARRVGPVGVAGDEKISVGEVRAAGAPGAFWIWAAMDNLVRGGALNAIEAAEALLRAGRPS
jgi:aspartate-semialdehyde dehydrogenase